MNPQKIEHIGIAVNSLKESIPLFEKLLGIKCYSIEYVNDQFVNTAFFLLGETKIELLESTDPSGPISNFINKNGAGIHHIAFSVNDTDESLTNIKNAGFLLIDRKSRQGAEGMKIGFLHPKSTNNILIEFCSK